MLISNSLVQRTFLVATQSLFSREQMAPYVVRAPLQPRLTDELFEIVLHKVTNVSKLRQPVVVDLAANNLQAPSAPHRALREDRHKGVCLGHSREPYPDRLGCSEQRCRQTLGTELGEVYGLGDELSATDLLFGKVSGCQAKLFEVWTTAKLWLWIVTVILDKLMLLCG